MARQAGAGKGRAAKSGGVASGENGAVIGYEASLWQMADKLRNNMDAAEYKHVVLGLLFLKYISDAFLERHEYLTRAVDDPADQNFLPPGTPNRAEAAVGLREDIDEYRAANIFWVPREARWPHLKSVARQPTVGRAPATAPERLVTAWARRWTTSVTTPRSFSARRLPWRSSP